ncbi:MAG: hypothetical protein M3O36_14915 [Myxococcota bacterium]|nr:hypothetical protein [Myxococcota bacterium]
MHPKSSAASCVAAIVALSVGLGCGGSTAGLTAGNADAAPAGLDADRPGTPASRLDAGVAANPPATLPDGGTATDPQPNPADPSGIAEAGSSLVDASVDASTDIDAVVPGAPVIGDDGYVNVSAGPSVLTGYVYSFVGGSSSSIALTYGATSFCASGTVGENSAYQSYAGAAFAVNQARTSTGGSVSPLLLSGTSITVRFANYGNSPLEIQLVDGRNISWCYSLPPSSSVATVPLTSFNTRCWDNSGASFAPGSAITAMQLVVPGSATSVTPFNFCFLGLTIQ